MEVEDIMFFVLVLVLVCDKGVMVEGRLKKSQSLGWSHILQQRTQNIGKK